MLQIWTSKRAYRFCSTCRRLQSARLLSVTTPHGDNIKRVPNTKPISPHAFSANFVSFHAIGHNFVSHIEQFRQHSDPKYNPECRTYTSRPHYSRVEEINNILGTTSGYGPDVNKGFKGYSTVPVDYRGL